MSKLNILEKSLNNSSFKHFVFEYIPDEYKITEYTEKRTRVWVAKNPLSIKTYLREFKNVGDLGFPYGGFVVWDDTNEQTSSYYYDCVVIHPDNFKKLKKQKKEQKRIDNIKGNSTLAKDISKFFDEAEKETATATKKSVKIKRKRM